MHFYDGLVLDHTHSVGDDVRGSLIKKLVTFIYFSPIIIKKKDRNASSLISNGST